MREVWRRERVGRRFKFSHEAGAKGWSEVCIRATLVAALWPCFLSLSGSCVLAFSSLPCSPPARLLQKKGKKRKNPLRPPKTIKEKKRGDKKKQSQKHTKKREVDSSIFYSFEWRERGEREGGRERMAKKHSPPLFSFFLWSSDLVVLGMLLCKRV